MINDNINDNQDKNSSDKFKQEADVPRSGANALNGEENLSGPSPRIEKFKQAGRKSFTPLFEVVQRYRGDIHPFIQALGKGLQASVSALTAEGATEQERIVSGWFKDVSEWFDSFQVRVESARGDELFHFLEDEASKRPGLVFGISYLAGLGIGRLGRHIGEASSSTSTSANIH